MLSVLSFRPEDQSKVRIAVGLRRVDPGDVPATAKPPGTASSSAIPQAGPSQKKRKAEFEALHGTGPTQSTAGPSQSTSQTLKTQTQHLRQLVNQPMIIDVVDIDDDVADDAPLDELYLTLRTNVVGVQYYKGMLAGSLSRRALTAVLYRISRRRRRGPTYKAAT